MDQTISNRRPKSGSRFPRTWLYGLACVVVLAALAAIWHIIIVYAQSTQEEFQHISLINGEPTPQRERQVNPDSPEISFIDSLTPTCYQPEKNTAACYIQWETLQVSAASSQYIISMTVSIDGRMRAYYGGFFQTSMFVSEEMHTPGFRVFCGRSGAGGIPGMGRQYSFVIKARETGGLSATNTGTILCPAGEYSQYLPQVFKP